MYMYIKKKHTHTHIFGGREKWKYLERDISKRISYLKFVKMNQLKERMNQRKS